LALIGVIAGVITWMLSHLGGFQWSLDEGLNLMRAWLMAQGFVLYRDIWADQPPLYTALLAGVLRLAGNSVEAGRALTVAHTTAGLLGVAWVVHELDRRWAGTLAAVGLLVLAPNFFWASRAVMPGLPALSLALLSAGATLAAVRTGRRAWLAAAGALLALSVLEKPISVYLVLPLLLAVVLRPRVGSPCPVGEGLGVRSHSPRPPGEGLGVRILLADLGAVFVAGAVPGLIALAVCDRGPLIDQVVGTYFQAREAYSLNLQRNLQIIGNYLTIDNLGLTALGTFGVLVLLRRRSAADLVMLLWVMLNLLAVATHSPLWPEHHLLPVLVSLAILAGVAVDAIIGQIGHDLKLLPIAGWRSGNQGIGDRGIRSLITEFLITDFLIFGLVALVVWLVALPRPLQVDARLLVAQSYDATGELPQPRTYAEAWQAVEVLAQATRPGDFVLTDSMMIAFRAGRSVPPWLSVLSRKRIETQELSDEDLIRASLEYAPAAVLLWDDRLTDFPEFLAWLRKWYRPGPDFGRDRVLYLPLGLAAVEVRGRYGNLPYSLGDQVELVGYRLTRELARPGETFELTLFWRGLRPMTHSYTVFTHLVGPDGQIHGQQDSLPAGGLLPTTAWRPGVIIPDEYTLPVAPEAPPGNYELEVGMYELDTGQRLAGVEATGERLAGDRILLTQVTIQ
jgi:hypothetical protein